MGRAGREVTQAVAKLGASVVGGCGLCKLAHEPNMMEEFASFGYPQGMEYPVGTLEVAACLGCVFRTQWGVPALLFTAGGGVYNVVRRASLPEVPPLCQQVEYGCAGVELTAVSFVATFCNPFRSFSPLAFRYDLAAVAAGAASACAVHAATGTQPQWIGWSPEAHAFVERIKASTA
eukprot:TRINITY_DN14338_c0_g2_i1.p1 TRINITY_DN14338_c0_g2~~TRINITY_DN14338_c0_g2_i1.p1  ORF type:complete len:177 (+),score=32.73 TRINITY_DN14338_c0_g2_i1:51-581(+)